MRVLVTGGAGYLGAVLVPLLLERGHAVTVVDTFAHGVPSLLPWCADRGLTLLRCDARHLAGYRYELEAADVLIPLAAVVGAAACDRQPIWAESTNVTAVLELARLLAPGQLLLFPMTNSGYGRGGEEVCTEASPLQPVSLYGRLKARAEAALLDLHPNTISFRFATLFGVSPRMRLDLLVNSLVYLAVGSEMPLTLYEGRFRRNFLHVRDAAELLRHVVAMPLAAGVYNAGNDDLNMTKLELCELIQQHVPGFTWREGVGKDPDQRDYVVSSAKLYAACAWRPDRGLRQGVEELLRAYALPLDEGTCRNA